MILPELLYPQYALINYSIEDQEHRLPIYYLRDKYNVVRWEQVIFNTFSKSQQHSKGICWAVFERKSDQQRFLVGNIHLSVTAYGHDGAELRAENIAELNALLDSLRQDYGNLPVFLLGDYNCNDQSEEFSALVAGDLTDSMRLAKYKGPVYGTFHNWLNLGTMPESGRLIDHILIADNTWVASWNIAASPEAASATDHYPVYIDAVLQR